MMRCPLIPGMAVFMVWIATDKLHVAGIKSDGISQGLDLSRESNQRSRETDEIFCISVHDHDMPIQPMLNARGVDYPSPI
jgi:hypothetical protein